MLWKSHHKINSTKRIIILIIYLTTSTCFGFLHKASSQQETYTDSVYLRDIRTVLLRNASWERSLPVIELGSDQQLELVFDDLSDSTRYFGYTLIHCDSEWHPSSISKQQSLQGFAEGEIHDMQRSFNTTYDYMHYSLKFPEENVKPIISGNYVIVVYDVNQPEKFILTRRFYIIERIVQIEGTVNRAPSANYYETGQLVQFSVIDPKNEIQDPNSELIAVIMQNERPDNVLTIEKPIYIAPGRYDYTYTDRIIFQGGNEFRNFDIKSLKYISEKISRIDFINPYYHVFLKPDESRGHMPYFSNNDLNGAYYIDREKAVEKHQEADYVYVHFKFNHPIILDGKTIYVFGMLTDWSLSEHNRMTYNPETGFYETTLLLKQGWYDYIYVLRNYNNKIDAVSLEGSYYETGNTYSIFIYHRDVRKYYDRLIGYLTLTTRQNF